jgi:hypothetical protein
MADTQHMYSNNISKKIGNSKRIIVYLGGGQVNTVESAKIGAKIGKITEKRKFPMILFH